jgi:ATP-dependent Lhr-like helicase
VPVPPGPGAGRWARVPAPAFGGDPEELAELVADLLLRRWGVVFRALLGAEALRLPWVEVCRALRRFEDRGLVLGGRFVAGIGGEQFALPEAAEELRRAAGSDSRTAGAGTGSVRISATDPCNLVGLLGLGPAVPALRTRTVEVPIPTAPSSGHRAAS